VSWLKKILPLDIDGEYGTWEKAVADSTGYSSPIILDRTKEAMKKVVSGEAVYERDSVLFDTVQYSYPVLAGLMWVAARYWGILHVLDFGGSLGTSYYQNYEFLRGVDHHWTIIEQPEYVEAGKELVENEYLSFFDHIDDSLYHSVPNVILCSSVLQYLEDPWSVLEKLENIPSVKCIIIDRTPFWEGDDWIGVQRVPKSIYPASYPIRIFSYKKFMEFVKSFGYEPLTEFQSLDNLTSPINAQWKGMILVKGGKK
jgi:putative methyltransferase (TIGR04325 family)